MSLEEDNKAVVRRLFDEAFNREGRLEVVDEICASDHVLHFPHSLEERGREAMRDLVALPRRISPDIRVHIEDEVAEGEKVVTTWTTRGTLADEMRSADSDDDGLTASGVTICRLCDGQIRETWWRFDARVDESRRALRDDIREFVLQDMRANLPVQELEEISLRICCWWTGCRC